jgi:anti-anti-sigma factor
VSSDGAAESSGARFVVVTRLAALGEVRVEVEGEVDLATSEVLNAEFDHALARRPEHIVVDLQQLMFCSCAGLGTLVRLHNTCRAAGVDLCLVPSGPVRRVMDLVGLSRELPLRAA